MTKLPASILNAFSYHQHRFEHTDRHETPIEPSYEKAGGGFFTVLGVGEYGPFDVYGEDRAKTIVEAELLLRDARERGAS